MNKTSDTLEKIRRQMNKCTAYDEHYFALKQQYDFIVEEHLKSQHQTVKKHSDPQTVKQARDNAKIEMDRCKRGTVEFFEAKERYGLLVEAYFIATRVKSDVSKNNQKLEVVTQ